MRIAAKQTSSRRWSTAFSPRHLLPPSAPAEGQYLWQRLFDEQRLPSGTGNALSIGERIRGLGAKAKGPMPTLLVDRVSIAAEPAEENAPLPSEGHSPAADDV